MNRISSILLSYLLLFSIHSLYSEELIPAVEKCYQEEWGSLLDQANLLEKSLEKIPDSAFKNSSRALLDEIKQLIQTYQAGNYKNLPTDETIAKHVDRLYRADDENSSNLYLLQREKNTLQKNLALKATNNITNLARMIGNNTGLLNIQVVGQLYKKNTPNKSIQELLNAIESICKANHMSVPFLYIGFHEFGYSESSFATKIGAKDILFLNIMLWDKHSLDQIKAAAAHELGHIYYQDSERCTKFQKLPNFEKNLEKYHHFIEYRADLFAAQYGFGKYLSQTLNKLDATNRYSPSSTHPALYERINYLKKLPPVPDFKTFYRPTFQPGRLLLTPAPRMPGSLKIIDSTAQPLRGQLPPQAKRTITQSLMNTLKSINFIKRWIK